MEEDEKEEMRLGLTRNANRRRSLPAIALDMPSSEEMKSAGGGIPTSLTMTMGSSCFFSDEIR